MGVMFTDADKKKLVFLAKNSKIVSVFLFVFAIFMLIVSVIILIWMLSAGGLSLQNKNIGKVVELFVQGTIAVIFGVYNFKFSKQVSKTVREEEAGGLMKAMDHLSIIYKVQVLLVYIAIVVIVLGLILGLLIPNLKH